MNPAPVAGSADASRSAALLLLAIASGYDSSSRLALRAPRPHGSVRGFIHNLLARLLERLLEEGGVRQHAVQVPAERRERRTEVPEGEPAAELREAARVLVEKAREHGERDLLDPAQIDDDAVG